jgi:ATPase subunit of ABC transporter with duplicated ATPase domains
MLQVHHVVKRHGALTVLDGVTLALDDGEHAGLIGPNGAGKTTLLRCITGDDPPDAGAITLSPGETIGYLPQAFASMETLTVDAAIDAAAASSRRRRQRSRPPPGALASGQRCRLRRRPLRFEALGGYARLHRAESVLAGLGRED